MRKPFNFVAKSTMALALSSMVVFATTGTNFTFNYAQASTISTKQNQLSLTYDAHGWGTAYCMNLMFSNTTGKTIEDWKITIPSKQLSIQSMWCANNTTSNGMIELTPYSWNKTIYENNNICFGMIGNGACPTNLDYTISYKIDGIWYDSNQGDYTILSSDTSLSSVSVKNIVAKKLSDTVYEVTLPQNVTLKDVAISDFIIKTTNNKATMSPVRYTTTSGNGLVMVTAEDGTVTTYTITVKASEEEVKKSSDASLGIVLVKQIPATKTSDNAYEVSLPAGTSLADVTSSDFLVKTSNNKATASSVRYSSTTGKGTLVVTAEDGTIVTYTITLIANASNSSNTLSSDTTLGIVLVKMTVATKTTGNAYEVTLPEGVTLTDITSSDFLIKTTNNKATLSTVRYTTTSGKGVVIVTAEDGTKATYTINLKTR